MLAPERHKYAAMPWTWAVRRTKGLVKTAMLTIARTAIADAANLGSVASTTKTASHVCKMPPTNAAALTAGR